MVNKISLNKNNVKEIKVSNCFENRKKYIISDDSDEKSITIYDISYLTGKKILCDIDNLEKYNIIFTRLWNNFINVNLNEYTNLKKLNISNIKNISLSIDNSFKNIIVLKLIKCPNLKFEIVSELPNLYYLEIRKCGLKSINFNKRMDNLRLLDLKKNKLDSLEYNIPFHNLESMNLNDNHIKSLILKYDNLSFMNLKHIDICENDMEYFYCKNVLKRLETFMSLGNNLDKAIFKVDRYNIQLFLNDKETRFHRSVKKSLKKLNITVKTYS